MTTTLEHWQQNIPAHIKADHDRMPAHVAKRKEIDLIKQATNADQDGITDDDYIASLRRRANYFRLLAESKGWVEQ